MNAYELNLLSNVESRSITATVLLIQMFCKTVLLVKLAIAVVAWSPPPRAFLVHFPASPLAQRPTSSLRTNTTPTKTSPHPDHAPPVVTTMRQTSLNLPRVAHGAASPLTSLLSQYELLTMLCENLLSADIVHLGATSKEHWQYIGHSSVIFKSLIADSTCDGKGIIAQARVFGHWQANLDSATRACRGKDAKPCSDCGAMICNVGQQLLALKYHN